MTDSAMEQGQQWLKTLLQLSGIPADVKANVDNSSAHKPGEESVDSYWLTIDETNLSKEQVETLIGSSGEVLDGIQYLANATLNLNQTEPHGFYIIELNGYRAKRQAELSAIALEAKEKVLTSTEEVEIKSLSSAERRQIHTILQEYPELETFSRGKEPHRHLVVRRLGEDNPG
ncbi:protein jag [Synechocystis sp. PCC 7509]|uniref:Jag family protein n=1 Tax=Synechocystis sp. PCC 7509 TaxID=927677 RepID=UPI0002ABBF66|nr:R3H domain-containing nucleic acid-binding protein [Synechocystis sp. PCC 7509]